jgi:uncharacterized membrane protein (DUF2068 family)
MQNASGYGAPARRIDGLRLIGLLKIGKAILLLATTYGLYRLLNPDLLRLLHDWINTLTDSFERRLLVRGLDWLDTQSAARFGSIVAVTALYTLLLMTEGIGLWLRKAWAEWFTVVSTSSLIPFELWHLFFGSHHNRLALLGATALNVIIVLYLIVQLRRARTARPQSAPGA